MTDERLAELREICKYGGNDFVLTQAMEEAMAEIERLRKLQGIADKPKRVLVIEIPYEQGDYAHHVMVSSPNGRRVSKKPTSQRIEER